MAWSRGSPSPASGSSPRCGIGAEAFWEGLLGPRPRAAAAVDDFDPEPYFDNPKEARRTDRFAQFALAAAQMALEQAGEITADPPRRRASSAPASAASTPSRSRSGPTTRRGPAGSPRSSCR